MWPQSFHRDPKPLAVMHDHIPVNGTGAQTPRARFQVGGHRAKKGASGVAAVPGCIKIFLQTLDRDVMGWDVTNFSAFSMHAEMLHTPSFRIIFDSQVAKLGAAHGMKEEHGENG